MEWDIEAFVVHEKNCEGCVLGIHLSFIHLAGPNSVHQQASVRLCHTCDTRKPKSPATNCEHLLSECRSMASACLAEAQNASWKLSEQPRMSTPDSVFFV